MGMKLTSSNSKPYLQLGRKKSVYILRDTINKTANYRDEILCV